MLLLASLLLHFVLFQETSLWYVSNLRQKRTHWGCCPSLCWWLWACGCRGADTRAQTPAAAPGRTWTGGCCTSGCESLPSADRIRPRSAQREAVGGACHLQGRGQICSFKSLVKLKLKPTDSILTITFTGFPTNHQVEGAHSAEGYLLGQIVDGIRASVAEHHCLAQQRSGWTQLKLLLLQNASNILYLTTLFVFLDCEKVKDLKGQTWGLSVMSMYILLEDASGHASVSVRENILNRDHSERRSSSS